MFNSREKTKFRFNKKYVGLSLLVLGLSPLSFGAQMTCANIFEVVNSSKGQKSYRKEDYTSIQKQAKRFKRNILIEIDPKTNQTYVLTERSDADNGGLEYTGHILHVIEKYPTFSKLLKISNVKRDVLHEGKTIVKSFSKILAIPDFNKNMDDLARKGYQVPSVRLESQTAPMKYTGPHMMLSKEKFMLDVLSRDLMGIDMSGHSYAHDYGQHLIGELLIPEAYRNVNSKISKAAFLIARNIAKTKNPFPADSDDFKYFEAEKQNLWSPSAVGRAAPEFSDLLKVELDIMDTYEWYTYLVQLDIIGSNEYGPATSVKTRIDQYLSKDVMTERLQKLRNFLAQDPVFEDSEIFQLLKQVEHDLKTYPSASTMAAEIKRTLNGMK